RGRPIAVGGGVVLAASYEARHFGVSGGMAGWKARQLCPDLLFVPGHFREYQRLGDEVMAVLEDVTPLVERISIDEAFCDVAGARRLFGSPSDIAVAIRRRVRDEIGLPISIGVARTKHLAKVASQVAKPDGLVIVEPHDEKRFLDPLPVSLVWGVGPATQRRLSQVGITTIGQLAAARGCALVDLLGNAVGNKLGALANNDDERPIVTRQRASSIGAQSAIGRRAPGDELYAEVFGHLADRVSTRLRAKGRAGRTITVRVRFAQMRAVTRSTTVAEPICSTRALVEIATELARTAVRENPDERDITLLAISVSKLQPSPPQQLSLLLHERPRDAAPAHPPADAFGAIDRSMDAVRSKFGRAAIGFGSVAFPTLPGVPDEFRSLAEKDR
ncbi:MAG: DNA polymerase IV, partial [Acidimicrobiia bacterium]